MSVIYVSRLNLDRDTGKNFVMEKNWHRDASLTFFISIVKFLPEVQLNKGRAKTRTSRDFPP